MIEVLALIFIFGGGAAVLISFSPVGRALGDRIRGQGGGPGPDPAVYEELDRLRGELAELQDRMDFAERLLAGARDQARLSGGGS